MKKAIFSLIMTYLLLIGCSKDTAHIEEPLPVPIRSSTIVSLFHKDPSVKAWLQGPGKAYFECHFMMPKDMAEDVVVGMDIEYGEGGGQTPEFFADSQWATILGVTRKGLLLFNYGSEASLNGAPDAGDHTGIDLKTEILPETWYRLRTEVDFKYRRYISAEIQGPNLDTIIDLKAHRIEYTLQIPFDQRNLTFYVLALRNQELTKDNTGKTYAYFDSVEGGIWLNGQWQTVFLDGFVGQTSFPDVPVSEPMVKVNDFTQGYWYRENEGAIVEISTEMVLEGQQSAKCNARLE